jgi:hypothetical protein
MRVPVLFSQAVERFAAPAAAFADTWKLTAEFAGSIGKSFAGTLKFAG